MLLLALFYGGPLLLAYSSPGTPIGWILLVAVLIALVDVGGVVLVLHGLLLLGEACWGVTVQTSERLEIGRTRAAGATMLVLAVRAEQTGALQLATPLPVALLEAQTSYTIRYSPRARILWSCVPATPEEPR